MWKLLLKAIKPKYLLYLVLFVGVIVFLAKFWNGAYKRGYDDCNLLFLEYKEQQELVTINLEKSYREQEKKYQEQSKNLEKQLLEEKEKFNSRIIAIEHDYANRLHDSEQRASVYKQMSRSSNNSCNSLADHSARLDLSLTEGRELVKQLRELIKLRDNQLRQCGEGLKNMQNFNKSEGWDGYGF